MRKQIKKVACLLLAMTVAGSMTGCGDSSNKVSVEPETSNDVVSETGDGNVADDANKTFTVADGLTTFDKIKIGQDYTDVSADLKFITHRTDLLDESQCTKTLDAYVKEFQQKYPNINIEFEGITDYQGEMTTRMVESDWGDICMIPPTIDKSELGNYFVSYGDLKKLSESYMMLVDKSFGGEVYGIPTVGNAQGIVYNKKVFEEAGITELPKTPDEFLDTLQIIKDKTDAIPLYTNFHAVWTMGAWDAYIGGCATGDADFMNNKLVHTKNPFAKRDDMTGPYAVYYTLYEAVARGLIEDDPTTTDWESCKPRMNNGEIATMALGSWAVPQIQGAGENADDIGYMPFPITVNGKQYATAGGDYNYGININSSEEKQIAAMVFVKWMTEESNFAFDQGCIPIKFGSGYPEVLDAFSDVELIIDNPALDGEEDYFTNVNRDSEVGINNDSNPDCEILEHALNKDMTLDEIMDSWNQKWTQGQEDNDIEITE